jgi:hypothetical protein
MEFDDDSGIAKTLVRVLHERTKIFGPLISARRNTVGLIRALAVQLIIGLNYLLAFKEFARMFSAVPDDPSLRIGLGGSEMVLETKAPARTPDEGRHPELSPGTSWRSIVD